MLYVLFVYCWFYVPCRVRGGFARGDGGVCHVIGFSGDERERIGVVFFLSFLMVARR